MTEIIELLDHKALGFKGFNFSLLNFIFLTVVLIITSYALKLIRKVVTKNLPLEDKNKFISIFQFIKYMVYIFVVMFVLHSSGVNMNVFLTASAALFVGIGFALQTFFLDIISGILIILDQSVHVGDIIEVEGKVGKVKEIRLRTTRIITRNDRVLVIPNNKFMTDILFNWTQNTSTNREQVTVGVAYGSDINLVKKLLETSAVNTEGVVKNETISVLFEDFGDSSLNFSVYFYVNDGMRSPYIQSDIRFKIDELFKQNNISIPFPQRDIHIINK
ncbi:mechanosensitive ion channel domain-containing protein [uncultured Flavobacterium sp.]|uniref:mechanosensitive ion channel family protein n=1 Tax=uncultured Flavobacterium sp. TaxID=165435 RepID=UPI0030CA57D0|tara:strand:- start:1459 stop:2283 length:825 start_codon:yes stop_codon:yes gene_type:complete